MKSRGSILKSTKESLTINSMARSRRMLANDIVTSDPFLKMDSGAQTLYFHLNIQADDDGFVAPLKVIRMIGAADDSINILKMKGFVIPFESGVIVIRHWRHHNTIRTDRYQPTSYLEEKRTLSLDGSTYNVLEHGNQMATIGRASKEVSKEVKGELSKKEELTETQINERLQRGREFLKGKKTVE